MTKLENDVQAALAAANAALDDALTSAEAAKAAAEAAECRASDQLASLKAARADVEALEGQRTAAVCACKSELVISVEGLMLPARVRVEIEAGKSKAAAEEYEAKAEELGETYTVVARCEEAVKAAERTVAAHKVEAAYAALVAAGQELQALCADDGFNRPINVPPLSLPPAVMKALSRLPAPHPLDRPIARYDARAVPMPRIEQHTPMADGA